MTRLISTIYQKITESYVYKSIIRHGYPDNDLDRSLLMNNNFFLHLHPIKMRKHGLKLNYTFGLGGISFFLFIVLVITGALLMFYYVPSTEGAYKSMLDLKYVVPYGRVLRNLHRWAAHAMVITVFLHLCRTFYTGSFKSPREFNWVMGVMLFVLTLLFSFTGYLLPWDQLAFWAITVATDMAKGVPLIGEDIQYILLGGNIVGQNALIRFYTMHVFVLTLAVFILLFIHFWRVRKDGFSGPPEQLQKAELKEEIESKTYTLMTVPKDVQITMSEKNDPEDSVNTFPNLIIIEIAVLVIVSIILTLVSVYFDAPLEEHANPFKTPNPAKAPWYFLGLQELVSHTTAFWGGFIIPAGIVIGLMIIPYFRPNRKGIGIWFSKDRKIGVILFTIFVIVNIILIFIGTYLRGPNWDIVLPF